MWKIGCICMGVGMLFLVAGCPPPADPCDGVECAEGETCVDGVCETDVVACDPECADGETCVDGVCETDVVACDPACAEGETCVDGACTPEGDGGETETVLDTINFDNDVTTDEDPTSLAIGGGLVDFSNGVAETRGILALYGSVPNSWMPNAGSSSIVFTDLDVRSISFYFAHSGDTGATLSALGADGAQIGDSVESVAAASFNDPAASFTIDGGGTPIASVSIETPDGAVVALDDLSLTVVE